MRLVTIEENDSIYNALAIQTLTIDGHVLVDNVVVQCTADPFGGDANCIQIETVLGSGLPAGGVALQLDTSPQPPLFSRLRMAQRLPLRRLQVEGLYPRSPSSQVAGRVQMGLLCLQRRVGQCRYALGVFIYRVSCFSRSFASFYKW